MVPNDQTLISSLTVGELKELLKTFQPEQSCEQTQADYTEKKYVYGLKGIRDTFNVSHATAQKYKDTFLKEAIIQNGRKIIVDVEKALQLFSERGGSYER